MEKHTRNYYIDKSIKILETRLDGMDRANDIKAMEIDRRLKEHNELRKEVITDRSLFMRAEVYQADRKSWQQWKDVVNDSLSKLMAKYDQRMSAANWIAIVAVVITLINLVMIIIRSFK